VPDCGKIKLWKNNFALQFNNKRMAIPFLHLHIFSKSLEQDIYQGLKNTYEKLSVQENKEIAHFFNKCEELISVNEGEPDSLVVFDDCVNERQQCIIKDYFSRGRHKNISCV